MGIWAECRALGVGQNVGLWVFCAGFRGVGTGLSSIVHGLGVWVSEQNVGVYGHILGVYGQGLVVLYGV